MEKPFTANYRQAKKLVDLAKEKGLIIFDAVTMIHMPNYEKIRKLIKEIGEIKMVDINFSQYSSRYDKFKKGIVLPALDKKMAGGALMDLGIYNINFTMGLFGKPKKVNYYANIQKGIDTSGVLVMKYPEFTALCVAAKDSKGLRGGIIQGTDGVIRSDISANLVGKITLELNDGTVEEYDDGMSQKRVIPEFQAFIRAINENDMDFCMEMLDKSIAVTEVQTQARRSAGVVFPADN